MATVGYPPQRLTGKTEKKKRRPQPAALFIGCFGSGCWSPVSLGEAGSAFEMAPTRRTTCRSKYVNISRFFNYLVTQRAVKTKNLSRGFVT